MALVPTLTLTDSTTFSDVINFTVTDSLTVTAPARSLSLEIATQTGGSHIIVPAGTAVTYVYIRHTGTTDGTTGSTVPVDVEDTADVAFMRLGAGEWAFFPANKAGGSTGVQLQVTTASNVQLEYAYWTKG